MAHDDAWTTETHRAHRRSYIASVLDKTVWFGRFIGVASTSEIECEKGTLASKPFGDADEVHVRGGQAMQRNHRRSAAWPITEAEFYSVPGYASEHWPRHFDGTFRKRIPRTHCLPFDRMLLRIITCI
jgi:hypothetical protein